MAVWGLTAAGFVTKPLANIQSDLQASYLGAISPQLDLSPKTPDGQIIGILSAQYASLWELAQVAYSAYNRADVEGAGLDNLGDITGTPREGASYTQVYCLLAFSAPGTYAPSVWTAGTLSTGTLVANVAGNATQAFANVFQVSPANLSGTVSVTAGLTSMTFSTPQSLAAGTVLTFASQPALSYTVATSTTSSTAATLTSPYTGTTAAATTAVPAVVVLMQSTVVGPTPTVNDGTVTQITAPVAGWVSVNNPSMGTAPNSSQFQVGLTAELDSSYALRQAQDVAGEGTCSAAATAAALQLLLASQEPPIAGIVTVLENTSNAFQAIDGLTLPPHTFAPIIWADGATWPTSATGEALIAAAIYANKPAGITSFGNLSVVVTDPLLGQQTISYTVPAGTPLYISVVVVARTGYALPALTLAIQGALAAAAVAPTPSTGPFAGVPPVGQLAPGAPVIGSQLAAVILGVPGVLDIKTQVVGGNSVPLLTFGFAPSPTNAQPLLVPAGQIATISPTTLATNVAVTYGAYP